MPYSVKLKSILTSSSFPHPQPYLNFLGTLCPLPTQPDGFLLVPVYP